METNTSNAIFIGVATFIFISAISATIILMMILSDITKVSLEKMQDADSTTLAVSEDINSNVITGHDILSYYANYVVPENEDFVFKTCTNKLSNSCSDLTEDFFKNKLDKYFIRYTSTTKNAYGEEVPLIKFVYCGLSYEECAEIEENTTR